MIQIAVLTWIIIKSLLITLMLTRARQDEMATIITEFDINIKSISDNLYACINGIDVSTRYISVDINTITALTIANMRSIAYELYYDYYIPDDAVRNITAGRAQILQDELVRALVMYIIANY